MFNTSRNDDSLLQNRSKSVECSHVLLFMLEGFWIGFVQTCFVCVCVRARACLAKALAQSPDVIFHFLLCK